MVIQITKIQLSKFLSPDNIQNQNAGLLPQLSFYHSDWKEYPYYKINKRFRAKIC